MLDQDPSDLVETPAPPPLEFEPRRHSTLVNSGICDAMDSCLAQIECGFVRGFAGMQLIGNTSEVCRDGKERARAALEHLGIHLPPRRLVVSLTPADLKKDGNQFDLPVAVSLALLLRDVPPRHDPSQWLFAAELGLMGELRPVKGVVSFAVAAMAQGLAGIVVAPDNLEEVAVLGELNPHQAKPLQALAFNSLKEVLAWLIEGQSEPSVAWLRTTPARAMAPETKRPDFDDMILAPAMELAALTVATGMHSLLMRGTPGTGKSMLAARLASILPNLNRAEHIEAMRIYSSVSERMPANLLMGRPTYRAPHHQASSAAILGGPDTPGEMALAHGGVLFLDELPEFRRDLLEALREPLETGEIRVSRAKRKVVWRSRVILVAACNNCPCGWFGSARRRCRCPTGRLLAYRQRLSGPILDRIDLHLNVPEPSEETASLFIRLSGSFKESPTARLCRRVEEARSFGRRRNRAFNAPFNRDLEAHHLVAASGLEPAIFSTMVNQTVPRSASSRAVIRCLRVARTLADLDQSVAVRPADLLQAWLWQAEPAARERGEELDG